MLINELTGNETGVHLPWSDYEIKKRLAETQVELKKIEYMCKRVIDDGKSIPVLFHNDPVTFTVVNGVPVNCKVPLYDS
jgi:hypothetical protein